MPVSSKVAIATCAELPDLDEDGRPLLDALAALGIQGVPMVWDADADWSAFDAVVVRSTWDYPQRRPEFLAWARGIGAGRLWNPPEVLAWNTDKTYLRQLVAAGISVVPTTWVDVDDRGVELPRAGDYVVKPAVSAGSKDTARYRQGEEAAALAHVEKVQRSGRVTMVQPYVASVDENGETALMYVDGGFSHAVRKGPLLAAGGGFVEGLYAEEEIAACEPSPGQRALADAVVDTARRQVGDLLYARVDVVEGPGGEPQLLELELTEPSLFLQYATGATARLATAIQRRLGRSG